MIKLKTAELDGKKIAYHSETVFRVQVGRNSSAYRDRYRITGNLAQAVLYYNGINISNGHKKRLYCDSMNKPTLARAFS